jgi:hypothetical protein
MKKVRLLARGDDRHRLCNCEAYEIPGAGAGLALSDMDAIIAPPVPAFYAKLESIEEMVDHTVGRMLDLFEIDVGTVRRWGEDQDLQARPVKN